MRKCPYFDTNPEGMEPGEPVPNDPEPDSTDLTEGDEIRDPPPPKPPKKKPKRGRSRSSSPAPPKKKPKREKSRSSSPAPATTPPSGTRITPLKDDFFDFREYSKDEFKRAFGNMDKFKLDLEDRWKEFVDKQEKLEARLVALEARPVLSEEAKEEFRSNLLKDMEGAVSAEALRLQESDTNYTNATARLSHNEVLVKEKESELRLEAKERERLLLEKENLALKAEIAALKRQGEVSVSVSATATATTTTTSTTTAEPDPPTAASTAPAVKQDPPGSPLRDLPLASGIDEDHEKDTPEKREERLLENIHFRGDDDKSVTEEAQEPSKQVEKELEVQLDDQEDQEDDASDVPPHMTKRQKPTRGPGRPPKAKSSKKKKVPKKKAAVEESEEEEEEEKPLTRKDKRKK